MATARIGVVGGNPFECMLDGLALYGTLINRTPTTSPRSSPAAVSKTLVFEHRSPIHAVPSVNGVATKSSWLFSAFTPRQW